MASAKSAPVPTAPAGKTLMSTHYAYDELNRLASAEETQNNSQTWRQTFTYDRYGNRSFDEANTTTLPKNCGTSPNFAVCAADKKMVNPAVNTANNRLSTTDGYAFDSSGNTTGDAEGRTFVYDAENKQVSVSDANGTIGQYHYDGDGRRVKKHVPATGETTVFVYDAAGKLVGEYSTVVQTGTAAKTVYTTNDHLGSPRINTDGIGQVVSRHDYHPFGEEIARTGYGSDTIRKQFTGYERDGETGLDYAQARYFASGHGRFSSPDNFLNATRPRNPASWNLYVYVLNNPLRFIDPEGELEKDPATGKIKFVKTGTGTVTETTEATDDNGNKIKIKGQQVYVTTSYSIDTGYVIGNDGTKIEASKAHDGGKVTARITDSLGNDLKFNKKDTASNGTVAEMQSKLDNAGYDATTDCHGTNFANGEVWINNPQVEKLLKADGYRAVTGNEGVQAGDIAVYSKGFETRKDGTIDLKGVEHSATFNADYTVKSKGGYQPLQNSIRLGPGKGTAWSNPNAKITVWTLRAKQ